MKSMMTMYTFFRVIEYLTLVMTVYTLSSNKFYTILPTPAKSGVGKELNRAFGPNKEIDQPPNPKGVE